MPSSYHGFLVDIVNEILWAKPESVLDIGVGFGKMGVLFREYCDVFCAQGYGKEHWHTRIDGIEIFKPYIMDHHRAVYSDLYIGNALEILPTLPNYDFIYCGDVLEHFSKEDGWKLLTILRDKATVLVMVIPIGTKWNQGAVFGNEHETHRSVWLPEHFQDAQKIKDATFNGKPLKFVVYYSSERMFTNNFKENTWKSAESRSGPGSEIGTTVHIRAILQHFLDKHTPKSLADIGCGDFNWFGTVTYQGQYTGIDISPAIINEVSRFANDKRLFVCSNPCTDEVPKAELYLCRDVLVHLCTYNALRVLRNIWRANPKGKLLTTHFPGFQNKEIKDGKWRPLDLCKHPFGLPSPRVLLSEKYPVPPYTTKSLGFWNTADLKHLNLSDDKLLSLSREL